MAEQNVNIDDYKELSREELDKINQDKVRKTLVNSYIMYDASIRDTIQKREAAVDQFGNKRYSDGDTRSVISGIRTMQEGIVNQYVAMGFTREDLMQEVEEARSKNEAVVQMQEKDYQELRAEALREPKNTSKHNSLSAEAAMIKGEKTRKPAVEARKAPEMNKAEKPQVEEVREKTVLAPVYMNQTATEMPQKPVSQPTNYSADGSMYGIVELPSNGECYPHKLSKVKVAYLTAYDENMIFSPNLYRDGDLIDYILKNKVKEDIDIETLVQGDIDAIVIWLRATSYGDEYPITCFDPEKAKDFDTSISLSKLKFREFNLKGDENGYFDFTLPITGDKLKFKFLNNHDNKILRYLKNTESENLNIEMMKRYITDLRSCVDANKTVSKELTNKLSETLDNIEEDIVNRYDENEDLSFTQQYTDTLIMSTMSVNGETDRAKISEYIKNLNVRDADAYRKYIMDNTPGVDFNIKVKRPKGLGGGSIDTFLRFDQFVFLNIK